ncbi:hypothetical protein AN478_13435 [Thiohalorhabdus denitrificans]|uniref:Uncharacterized protein n=1 Tax=Thiohalorhabdus denitrificans TaxID=381306 RepID=A0A0P9C6V4_9GAMM|nr:hypothetical protein [Thiohalorhabdus denitrificans]KPV38930.1 hypothetical protein AN478_13435 [Thiohalorhabdus denitrificans]SCY68331.1 hypothetical protein SAMN05661077_0145 [Thiohalorhabdus denitrificans]
MNGIIRSRAELREVIENGLGADASDYLIDKLCASAWEEAREAGFGPGDDWTDFLAGVDWREKAGDVIAADIQAKFDKARK